MNNFSYDVNADSVPGPQHIRNEIPNQDSYGLGFLEGSLVLAVADGAGSLSRSHEGSSLAAETAVHYAQNVYATGKATVIEALSLAILETRSKLLSLDYWKEAGCTLTVALVTPERYAVAAIGDSFSVLHTTDGALTLVQPPEAGEFANITKLITSDDWTCRIAEGPTGELENIALCSDAFEVPTLSQGVPLPGFWGKIFLQSSQSNLEVSELISYMDSKELILDDATMVVASIVADEPDEEEEIQITDHSIEQIEEIVQGWKSRMNIRK